MSLTPEENAQIKEIVENLKADIDEIGTTNYSVKNWQNVYIVSTLGGDYSSIQNAIDAAVASGAAAGNRWVIFVMPGEYTENVTMAQFVDVIGISKQSVKITAAAGVGVTHAADSLLAYVTIEFNTATATALDMANDDECEVWFVDIRGDFTSFIIDANGGRLHYVSVIYTDTGDTNDLLHQTTNPTNPMICTNCEFRATNGWRTAAEIRHDAEFYDCVFEGRQALDSHYATAVLYAKNCRFIKNDVVAVPCVNGGGTFDHCSFEGGDVQASTLVMYLNHCTLNNEDLVVAMANSIFRHCSDIADVRVSADDVEFWNCHELDITTVNMSGDLWIYNSYVRRISYTGGTHTIHVVGNSYDSTLQTNANRSWAGNDIAERTFPVTSLGTGTYERIGSNDEYVVHTLAAGEDCNVENIEYPDNMALALTHELRYIPVGTGDWDYTINTRGATCGEDKDTNSDSDTDDGIAVTDDEIECLDISAAFTPYAAGDTIGCKITNDADTVTSIQVLCVRVQMILRD